MEDNENVNGFQRLDPEFKIKMSVEYLELRIKRLSQKQLDALYKRLLEFEGGNIIIPEPDNGFDAKEKPAGG